VTAAISSRDDAVAADKNDELHSYRDHFQLPDGVVYLDGNSLGPPCEPTLAAIREIQAEWARDLVTSWDRWLELPTQVGDALGESLLGAARGQVIVADSTTVNLYKTIAAALALRPARARVVIDDGSFPTDRYIVEQLGGEVHAVAMHDVAAALDPSVAVTVLSAVDYRSAALADIEALTTAAHDVGALVLWDVCHAVGAVPLRLDAWSVDFAVGCTYKYLNAGPGSPAFLYVRQDLQADVEQPIPGWFGHADQFAMETGYRPAAGISRFLTGTPNIQGTAAVHAGVGLLRDAGLDRLHTKSNALTQLAIERADALPASFGFEVATPRESARRGSHVALRHRNARDVCAVLAHEHRVITDHRPPDILRLGFAPLYTRFVDVWDAFDAIALVGQSSL